MNHTPTIQTDPEILGGTPVFAGTRVPVENLFEYLEAGDSLDSFLNDFPSVNREQAVAVLEAARQGLDPNVWSGSVEIVAGREIGQETVRYVSNIFKYYLAYKMVMEDEAGL